MWMVTSWSRRDLWVKNIEPEYRDMALHMGVGEDGLEQWFSEGKGDRFLSRGTSANMATVSRTREWRQKNIFENPSVTWEQGREMNPGACDPDARVELMNMEGIDKSILYPSLGLSWIGGTKDPALAAAYCRVYNDWLVDFCSAHPDRLYPAIALPWTGRERGGQGIEEDCGSRAKGGNVPGYASPRQVLRVTVLGPVVGGVPGARPTACVARERWRNSDGQSPAPGD